MQFPEAGPSVKAIQQALPQKLNFPCTKKVLTL